MTAQPAPPPVGSTTCRVTLPFSTSGTPIFTLSGLYRNVQFCRNGKKIDQYDGAKTLDGMKAYLKTMKTGEPKPAKKKATAKKSKKKTGKSEL